MKTEEQRIREMSNRQVISKGRSAVVLVALVAYWLAPWSAPWWALVPVVIALAAWACAD